MNVARLPKIDFTPRNVRAFQRSLLRWYRHHGRDLPWRRTRDPYRILVSEFMLQQTQVGTVLPYYKEWLRRFPNFAALARASEREILRTWQGLGYYARARNLHAAAKLIVNRHGGRVPKSVERIQQLPGVGKYTAHAVATFAFDQALPIVEANTLRVLSRLFDFRNPVDSLEGRKAVWSYATELVPKRSPAQFNSALVDLGATICRPRNPRCEICPVKRFCGAKEPDLLPVKRPRPRTKRLIERHVLVRLRRRILLQYAVRRWRGMWILPAANGSSKNNRAIYSAAFPFTNHRITLQIFRSRHPKIDKRHRWFARRELEAIPIPSPHRRAINALLN